MIDAVILQKIMMISHQAVLKEKEIKQLADNSHITKI